MDISDIVITEITNVCTVYNKKKRFFDMKSRPYWGLSICIDDGEITYTQGGKNYKENRLNAVLLPMGQSYTLYGDRQGLFPLIDFLTLRPLTDEITVLSVKNPDYLMKCYNEIHKLYSTDGSKMKMLSLLYEMLDELTVKESSSIIAPAIAYIHENYSKKELSNKLLSDMCNISEVYFRKLFREQKGMGAKKYIISLRLKMAKQLLAEGKNTVASIAADCGFDSSEHFSRVFKDQIGFPPGEYRKANQVYKI